MLLQNSKTSSVYASGKQKSMIDYTLPVVVLMCAEKSRSGERERLEVSSFMFYLISCHIFIGWSVNVDRTNEHTVQ